MADRGPASPVVTRPYLRSPMEKSHVQSPATATAQAGAADKDPEEVYMDNIMRLRARFGSALSTAVSRLDEERDAEQLQKLESAAKFMLQFDSDDVAFYTFLKRALYLDKRLAELSGQAEDNALRGKVYDILNSGFNAPAGLTPAAKLAEGGDTSTSGPSEHARLSFVKLSAWSDAPIGHEASARSVGVMSETDNVAHPLASLTQGDASRQTQTTGSPEKEGADIWASTFVMDSSEYGHVLPQKAGLESAATPEVSRGTAGTLADSGPPSANKVSEYAPTEGKAESHIHSASLQEQTAAEPFPTLDARQTAPIQSAQAATGLMTTTDTSGSVPAAASPSNGYSVNHDTTAPVELQRNPAPAAFRAMERGQVQAAAALDITRVSASRSATGLGMPRERRRSSYERSLGATRRHADAMLRYDVSREAEFEDDAAAARRLALLKLAFSSMDLSHVSHNAERSLAEQERAFAPHAHEMVGERSLDLSSIRSEPGTASPVADFVADQAVQV